MSLVIVTSHQYIIASKIYDITLDESHQTIEYRNSNGRIVGAVYKIYTITVHYVPSNPNNNSSREDVRECVIAINSKLNAHKIYQDLIRQIREQMPDELYLDKAFEHLLKVENDTVLDEEPMEAISDRSTKTIRRSRKAKRTKKLNLRR